MCFSNRVCSGATVGKREQGGLMAKGRVGPLCVVVTAGPHGLRRPVLLHERECVRINGLFAPNTQLELRFRKISHPPVTVASSSLPRAPARYSQLTPALRVLPGSLCCESNRSLPRLDVRCRHSLHEHV